MDTFFHEKFVSLFSMLFGVSLFLVGGERGDKARGRVLARRLAVLFGFGMLHGFGLWWGDILSLYAATGALMFFCRSWGPKTLMALGLLLFVLWAQVIVAAASNGVNLTDGLDGLATGAATMVAGAFVIIGIWESGQSCQVIAVAGPNCYEVRDPLDLAVVHRLAPVCEFSRSCRPR